VRLSSVQRAIKTGRVTSVGEDAKGRPVILDPAQAAAEWKARTRPRVDSRKVGQAPGDPNALEAATLRERLARAESFELETARKKGLLVSAADVERRWVTIGTEIRNGLLGLPTRARQRVPHLSARDLLVLERLVREVLEALADLSRRLAS